jgi:serine/threonine protein kinase
MLHTPCTPCTLYRRLSDYNMASVPVGAGRYSIVYPATEVATGRGVMVKVLRDSVHWKVQRYVFWSLGFGRSGHARCSMRSSPVFLAPRPREYMILKRLQEGPNIVQLLDIFRVPADQANGSVHLVFEHIDGMNLQDLSAAGPLSRREVRHYTREILKVGE